MSISPFGAATPCMGGLHHCCPLHPLQIVLFSSHSVQKGTLKAMAS